MNIQITAESAEKTEAIGGSLGRNLLGGEVIELVSDLGGGKTTFTRGLAAGAGSLDRVSSPTFTVSKEYTVPEQPDKTLRTIVHTDLYRITEPGLMEHELADSLNDPSRVLVIEWAERMAHVLPENRIVVRLSAPTESSRNVEITCPDSLGYVIEGVA